MTKQPSSTSQLEPSVRIVAAYVGNHALPATELAGLMQAVFDALSGLDGATEASVEPDRAPALPIRQALTEDTLFCLECGKPMKSLKRHLSTAHNLTPDAYRERWGLASDYPMVAPSYAAQRATIAKRLGLGKRR